MTESSALVKELASLWRLRLMLAAMTRRELAVRTAGSAGGLLGLVSGERIVRFYCEVFL